MNRPARHSPEQAPRHYNSGVVLEQLGRPDGAKRRCAWCLPAAVALALAVALAGAAREAGRRVDDVRVWRSGPAAGRAWLHYGPYADVIPALLSRTPPGARMLLVSDWDPALLAYYLHPRTLYQPDVQPDTDHVFMQVAPAGQPRRSAESFAVDWVVTLRDEQGAVAWEIREARRP